MKAARRETPTAARAWLAAGAAAAALLAWRILPLRSWLEAFQAWISGLGLPGGALFVAAYGIGTLLFVPGSALTLAAGYVFGVAWGAVVVLLGAALGAALAFLIARHFARERVEKFARTNRKFASIDRAIGRNGWKVVGLLRLSPLFPFSIASYFLGLTPVRFFPYLAMSILGILPGTFIYLSLGAAGKSLGESLELRPWQWALLGPGLLATVAVTLVLARLAKKPFAPDT